MNQFPTPTQHPPAPAAQPRRRRSDPQPDPQGQNLSAPQAAPQPSSYRLPPQPDFGWQNAPQPAPYRPAARPANDAQPMPQPAPSRPAPPPPPARPSRETMELEDPEKKTSSSILSLWQYITLALLAVSILIAYLLMVSFQKGIRDIEEQNTLAQRAYQRSVEQHTVKYRDWIEYYAAANHLDPAYVAAIIMTESSYDPQAVNKRTQATGLMQFMADTLEWVGPKFGVASDDMDALKDPETAIKLGCYLLNYITKQFDGDPILTACAYHAGWGNVRSWLSKYSTDGKTLAIDQIPTDDTRNYARKVLNSYAIYQQHYY